MEFSASHRLWREDWDAEHNRAVFGALASPHSHGHNYELEVSLRGRVEVDTGMVMDLKQLAQVMDAEVGARFDHRDLVADTPWFAERPATAENFAGVIFELLDRALPGAVLDAVRLHPTEDLWVEVCR